MEIKELLKEMKQTDKVVAEAEKGFVIERNGRFGKEFTCFFVNQIGCIDWTVYRKLESAKAQLGL